MKKTKGEIIQQYTLIRYFNFFLANFFFIVSRIATAKYCAFNLSRIIQNVLSSIYYCSIWAKIEYLRQAVKSPSPTLSFPYFRISDHCVLLKFNERSSTTQGENLQKIRNIFQSIHNFHQRLVSSPHLTRYTWDSHDSFHRYFVGTCVKFLRRLFKISAQCLKFCKNSTVYTDP